MNYKQNSTSQKPKRLLIVGSGHNGSTLLGLFLGAHSSIEGVGEWHNINHPQEVCSCGAPMQQDPFWKALKTQIPPTRYRNIPKKEGRFVR